MHSPTRFFLLRNLLAWLILLISGGSAVFAAPDDLKFPEILTSSEKHPRRAVLNCQARISFGKQSEIEESVEHGEFYLLKRNVFEILNETKLDLISVESGTLQTGREVYLEAAAKTLLAVSENRGLHSFFSFGYEEAIRTRTVSYPADEETFLAGYLIKEGLKKDRIKVFELDKFTSSLRFEYQTGKYYIFGFGSLNGELFVWERTVVLEPGENTFEFDQYNAEVFSGN